MKKSTTQPGNAFFNAVDYPGLDEELARVLNPVFPEPEVLPNGVAYYTPDEVKNFDALFERFGLRFRSSDDRFDDTRYLTELWYRLVNKVGNYMLLARSSPRLFALKMAELPVPWSEYIQAVMAGDRTASQRLAEQLDIENLDAFCIKGVYG